MRPYYLYKHLQVFTFHERGFPNITPSCTALRCSWMKFRQRMRPNQCLQKVFYKRPGCRGKRRVLVTLSWGGCGRAGGKHHVCGRHHSIAETGKSFQDWKKNGEKTFSWIQPQSWLQGRVWFFLLFWHWSLWTQFSLGSSCKLFPRTPQWGSCGEFATHGV